MFSGGVACPSWSRSLLAPVSLWLTLRVEHGFLMGCHRLVLSFFRADETHDAPGFPQWDWLSL